MSVSRPARCLFSAPSLPTARPRIICRSLHTSPPLHERRKPRHASIKASDMGIHKPAEELFKGYTEEEKKALKKKYTPAQLKAIEAGEAAIDINDLNERGVIRTDLGALPYLEDFSRTRPMLDRNQKFEGPLDPTTRPMTTEEVFAREKFHIDRIMRAKPPPPPELEPDSIEYQNLVHPNRIDTLRAEALTERYVDKNGPVPLNKIGYSLLAPGLPAKIFEESKISEKEENKPDPRDLEGIYNKLILQTGLTLNEILSFKVKMLVKHRVMNQTRLGKVSSIYCLAIAGNRNGMLGLGEAKGQEIEATQNNARIMAIKNMKPVPRYEERTIFGDIEAKVSAVEVKMSSRPPGFGLRCHHNIFEMARAAGIHDLSAKVPRSRNKMNTVKAAYQALMNQRIPDEIARGLGKKLVDVRKVYYGGR